MTTRRISFLRRIPSPVGDGLLALAVLLAQLAPFVSTTPPPGQHGWPPVIFLPVVASAVPLIWRRRAPLAVLLLTELSAGLYDLLPGQARQPVWFGALLAMFTLATKAPRWQRIGALVVTGVGASLVTGSLDTATRGGLLSITAYALGRAWAARGAQAEALEERARHLEGERELEAARERARIGREMHDILGHGVSVMIAQAEAGPIFIGRDDAKVEAAFDAITAAGREAMTQLRRILDVLDDDGESAGSPTLADLGSLVARVAAAGLRTELVESGPVRALAAEAEVAAYRITQEALTNVLKHAGRGRQARIALDWNDEALVVTITDDGPGELPHPSSVGRGDSDRVSRGRGLAGIVTRATACGGRAWCGPRTDAPGFEVSAWLPVHDTASLAQLPTPPWSLQTLGAA